MIKIETTVGTLRPIINDGYKNEAKILDKTKNNQSKKSEGYDVFI